MYEALEFAESLCGPLVLAEALALGAVRLFIAQQAQIRGCPLEKDRVAWAGGAHRHPEAESTAIVQMLTWTS